MKNPKCVLVIDPDLPRWLIANTASVLSITLGSHIDSILGPDVADGSGALHTGITSLPIPILQGSADQIKHIREEITANGDDIFLVDFNRTAQSCRYYDDYIAKLSDQPPADIDYLGIGIYGHRKKIDRLTKGLSMLGE